MKKISFGESLKRARIKSGLSQLELADMLFVTRSTVANWEADRRVPDFATISKLSVLLKIDVGAPFKSNSETDKKPLVIIVDDEKIVLNGGIPILEKVLPDAEIIGFTKPSEAIEYSKNHRIDLAFLDIEMGMISGLDVCRELLEQNPNTNVIYLTAYMEYAFDAWATGASGFILKPLTEDAVQKELLRLRYPVKGLEVSR